MSVRMLLASTAMVLSVATANAQITIVGSNVPFVNISSSGTSIGTPTDDSETIISAATLATAGFTGNGLLPGGVPIRVGNNGAIVWGNSSTDTFTGATEIGYTNSTTLATMTAANTTQFGNAGTTPRQFLAPLWDDHTPGTGGSIRFQVNSGDLIIQWSNEDHFSATGTGTVTFQAIIRGGVTMDSGASLVDFVYEDTLYAASQYQNDGGSATIGYKNWGVNPLANDVEFGIGGGTNTNGDPVFNGTNMQPKVGGWSFSADSSLPHSVSILAPVPEPTSLLYGGLALVGILARRRSSFRD